jgi:SH3 domain protein
MIKTIFILFLMTLLTTKSGASDIISEKTDESKNLYVTDQLRLSIYEGIQRKGKFIQYLISGDKVTATQYKGPYAFISTENGKEGWVEGRYLVVEKPNIILLRQEQEKNKALEKQLGKLPNTLLLEQQQKENKELLQQLSKLTKSSLVIDKSKKGIETLNKLLIDMKEAKNVDQLKIIDLKRQINETQKKALISENDNKTADLIKIIIKTIRSYWYYVVLICLGLILIGFTIAKKLLEARMKRKFQGIKVW